VAPPPAGEAQDEAAEREAEAALEAELSEETDVPSIALGPVRRGRPMLSGEVGWLRSGLRFDLGVARRIDLVARIDTMALYDALSGQNAVAIGLRVTPFSWQRLRIGAEATIGQLFSPTDAGRGNLTALRGELTVGWLVGPAAVYARGAVRGLRVTPLAGTAWTHDEEVGAGLEGRWRRWVAGGEVFALARPGLDTLTQWRIRLGLAL
jgi:hypothetical protein